jgi:transposase
VRSVGEYLKRWGFTPQKPIRRAYEQSPVAGCQHEEIGACVPLTTIIGV